MDRAFSALDADGSGSLTFAELNQQLGLLLAHDGGRHVAIRTKLRGHATKAAGAALRRYRLLASTYILLRSRLEERCYRLLLPFEPLGWGQGPGLCLSLGLKVEH